MKWVRLALLIGLLVVSSVWTYNRLRRELAIRTVYRYRGDITYGEGRFTRPVISVSIWDDQRVTDNVIEDLAAIDELEGLALNGTAVRGTGFKHLKGLKRLRRLSLRGCNLSQEGLEQLTGLERLEELDLSRSNLIDTDMRFIGRLRQLRKLYLGRAQITDAGLAQLENLQQLQKLQIVSPHGTAAGWSRLRSLKSLRMLDACSIPEEAVEGIAKLDQVETLCLWGDHFSPACVKHLQALRHFRSLWISPWGLGDEALPFTAVVPFRSLPHNLCGSWQTRRQPLVLNASACGSNWPRCRPRWSA